MDGWDGTMARRMNDRKKRDKGMYHYDMRDSERRPGFIRGREREGGSAGGTTNKQYMGWVHGIIICGRYLAYTSGKRKGSPDFVVSRRCACVYYMVAFGEVD